MTKCVSCIHSHRESAGTGWAGHEAFFLTCKLDLIGPTNECRCYTTAPLPIEILAARFKRIEDSFTTRIIKRLKRL